MGVTRAFHMTDSEAETREALDHHYHVLANNRKLSSDPNSPGAYFVPNATGNADDTWLIGTRDQIVRRIEALQAEGVEYIMLLDTAGDIASLERFAAEIAPLFDSEMGKVSQKRGAA